MKPILFLFSIFIVISFARADLPSLINLQNESNSLTWKNAISHSIIIHAPIEEVWTYVSDSSFASEWSIYFDHISFLNTGGMDGTVGSFRRCFRQANEMGGRWDEQTIEVKPLESRQIVMFNMQGYFMNKLTKNSYSFVRQIYKSLDDRTTQLTFQTQASLNNTSVQSLIYGFYKAQTKNIFKKNLENIAAVIEHRKIPHNIH